MSQSEQQKVEEHPLPGIYPAAVNIIVETYRGDDNLVDHAQVFVNRFFPESDMKEEALEMVTLFYRGEDLMTRLQNDDLRKLLTRPSDEHLVNLYLDRVEEDLYGYLGRDAWKAMTRTPAGRLCITPVERGFLHWAETKAQAYVRLSRLLTKICRKIELTSNAELPAMLGNFVADRITKWDCYDEQTRILTDDGFRYFRDLKGTEKVATLNPTTGSLEWQKPVAIQNYPYDGMMIAFKGQHCDFMVTPNHKMYVKWGRRPFALVRADAIARHLQRYKRAPSHDDQKIRFRRNAPWHCSNLKTVKISSTTAPHAPLYEREYTQLPKPKLVSYQGRVYCVTTRNGIVLTERNGKIGWSGNSGVFEGDSGKLEEERTALMILAANAVYPLGLISEEGMSHLLHCAMRVIGLRFATNMNYALQPFEREARVEWGKLQTSESVQTRLAWIEKAISVGGYKRVIHFHPQPLYAKGAEVYLGRFPTPFMYVPRKMWKRALAKDDDFPVDLLTGNIPLVPIHPRHLFLMTRKKQTPQTMTYGPRGCLVGDERIVLANGKVEKIQDMGRDHLQPINLRVRTGGGIIREPFATSFLKYSRAPIIEVITESGRSLKGTPEHPVLLGHFVRTLKYPRRFEYWKQLREIRVGDMVRVVRSLSVREKDVRGYQSTGWVTPRTKHRKFQVRLPEKVDEELAALLGFLVADGCIHRDQEVTFYPSEDEHDLTITLREYVRRVFDAPVTVKKTRRRMFMLSVNRTPVARALLELDGVAEKRIPRVIWQSKNSVAASFLSWLFEGDGSVTVQKKPARHRLRPTISLSQCSSNIELLRDVQMMLLRWGIHSRVTGWRTAAPALIVARSRSIQLFAEHIGFPGRKKSALLQRAVDAAREANRDFTVPSYERVVEVRKRPDEDVYDIEVPDGHRFIANGFISHNSGKTTIQDVIGCWSIDRGCTVFRPTSPRDQGLLVTLPMMEYAKDDWDYLCRKLKIQPRGYPAKFLTLIEKESDLRKMGLWTCFDVIIQVEDLSSFHLPWAKLLDTFTVPHTPGVKDERNAANHGYLACRDLADKARSSLMRSTLIRDFMEYRLTDRTKSVRWQTDELQDILSAIFGSSEEAQVVRQMQDTMNHLRGLNLPFDGGTIRPANLQPEILEFTDNFIFGELRESGAEKARSSRGRVLEALTGRLDDQEKKYLTTVEKIMENVGIKKKFLFFMVGDDRKIRLIRPMLPPHMLEDPHENSRKHFENFADLGGENYLRPINEVERITLDGHKRGDDGVAREDADGGPLL